MKFVDLFSGIGGFHYALKAATESLNLPSSCVFASDIDERCRASYKQNFGIEPVGDITTFDAHQVPEHDIFVGRVSVSSIQYYWRDARFCRYTWNLIF